jgi:hypothetical protein
MHKNCWSNYTSIEQIIKEEKERHIRQTILDMMLGAGIMLMLYTFVVVLFSI